MCLPPDPENVQLLSVVLKRSRKQAVLIECGGFRTHDGKQTKVMQELLCLYDP